MRPCTCGNDLKHTRRPTDGEPSCRQWHILGVEPYSTPGNKPRSKRTSTCACLGGCVRRLWTRGSRWRTQVCANCSADGNPVRSCGRTNNAACKHRFARSVRARGGGGGPHLRDGRSGHAPSADTGDPLMSPLKLGGHPEAPAGARPVVGGVEPRAGVTRCGQLPGLCDPLVLRAHSWAYLVDHRRQDRIALFRRGTAGLESVHGGLGRSDITLVVRSRVTLFACNIRRAGSTCMHERPENMNTDTNMQEQLQIRVHVHIPSHACIHVHNMSDYGCICICVDVFERLHTCRQRHSHVHIPMCVFILWTHPCPCCLKPGLSHSVLICSHAAGLPQHCRRRC